MNNYIIGESSTGKTKALLEAAKEMNAIVVCQNPDAMRSKAQCYGIYRLEFCGYDEIKSVKSGRTIVIDEIGDFFKSHYGVSMGGFNMTEE